MLARALLRFPARAQCLRASRLQCQYDHAPRAVVLVGRSYATPGRPKSVVGEPSRPVKRAVKKAAREPARGDSAAEVQVRTKRRKAATKKAKKVLTPEQKEAKKEKARVASEKSKMTELKQTALTPPKKPRVNSYHVFLGEEMKKIDLSRVGSDAAAHAQKMGNAAKRVAAQYKALTPAELEHYNHLANQKRQTQQAEYKEWVESHTPEVIHRANNARKQLRGKLVKENPGKSILKWPAIHDERAIRRPTNSFAHFCTDRHASGDFRNIALGQRSKLIAKEWQALDHDEKQKYQNLYDQDKERYASEYKALFGHATPSANGRHATLAAAAA